VVTNDRWGSDTRCKHGGYLTCSDRFNPGKIQSRKWENCMTIDTASWGYRRNVYLNDYLTIEKILQVTKFVQADSLPSDAFHLYFALKDCICCFVNNTLCLSVDRMRKLSRRVTANSCKPSCNKPLRFCRRGGKLCCVEPALRRRWFVQ